MKLRTPQKKLLTANRYTMNPAIEILETALAGIEEEERDDRGNGRPDQADQKAVKAGHVRKALNSIKDNEEIPINPGSICSATKDGIVLKDLRPEMINDVPTYKLYLRGEVIGTYADPEKGKLEYNKLKV